MDRIQYILYEQSPVQAVVVLSVIIAGGLGLGKIHVFGISLGVTWVFFSGILAGQLGLAIDPAMLNFAESFGLVLFVYELGLKVGPGFFSSFRKGGVKLNMLGLATILLGTAPAIALAYGFSVPMADMPGILSGATTNTPALGAAQQALEQLGVSASGMALSCAVTYPLGVVGVILAIVVARKLFTRPSDIADGSHENEDHTYIATFLVENPAIFGTTLQQVAQLAKESFVVSRLWRGGEVSIPNSATQFAKHDKILVITNDKDVDALMVLVGRRESRDWNTGDIDWNKIDSILTSRHIVVSKPELNGRKLGSLRLRNDYDINITRVMRSGVRLLAAPGLVLQLGDRLTVVGRKSQIEKAAKVVGNTTTKLKDPHMAAIIIGLVLGLLLGSIPIVFPGISAPVRLGLAGGPIVVGILIGRFGPQMHLVTYTTRSANLMLRGIGLSLFLACLGLDSGANFMATITDGNGLLWIGLGFIITTVPSIIMIFLAMRASRLDFGSACGMLTGAMANPMALNYASDTIPGDNAAVAYATVYPIGMFARVVIAQLLILIFV